MIRNLSQNTIEKMRAKRLAEYERLNGVVLSALAIVDVGTLAVS